MGKSVMETPGLTNRERRDQLLRYLKMQFQHKGKGVRWSPPPFFLRLHAFPYQLLKVKNLILILPSWHVLISSALTSLD